MNLYKNTINLGCVFLLCLCAIPTIYAQKKHNIDSLLNELTHQQQEDTIRVKTLNRLAAAYAADDFARSIAYAKEAASLAKSIGFTPGQAYAYCNLAETYQTHQFYVDAIDNFLYSEKLYTEAGISQKNMRIYNNLGMCYSVLNLYKEAEVYYEKAAQLAKEKDGDNYGRALNNLFIMYKHNKAYDKAEWAYREAHKIFQESNFEYGVAILDGNMATLFILYEEYDSALVYIQKALDYGLKNSLYFFVSLNKLNMAEVYNAKNAHTKAKKLLDEATYYFALYKEGDRDANASNSVLSLETSILKELSHTFSKLGKYKEAYETRLKYEALNDSIFNADLAQKLSESESKSKNYQSLKEIELLKKEQQISELESHKNTILLLSSAVLILLLLVLGSLLYQRYRAKHKSNQELTQMNIEISEQKKEITDSINYARRIQEAILPPQHYVNNLLPNSFIMYRPKDIVSGDFYFIEQLDDSIYFAAVDCTGHGVPGAMMSVLGFNLISQALHEKGKRTPADILQYLDWGVNKTLRQSDEGNTVKDGMDLAVCRYQPASRKLQYAGVQNPLYMISAAGEFTIVKADKSPIGINVDGIIDEYTNHEMKLNEGDCVYIFTDGFADQMGGEKGKKFMYKPFRELLLSVSTEDMPVQLQKITQAFDRWKGKNDQIDDVLVMGMKV